jgi:hypothetical protein
MFSCQVRDGCAFLQGFHRPSCLERIHCRLCKTSQIIGNSIADLFDTFSKVIDWSCFISFKRHVHLIGIVDSLAIDEEKRVPIVEQDQAVIRAARGAVGKDLPFGEPEGSAVDL